MAGNDLTTQVFIGEHDVSESRYSEDAVGLALAKWEQVRKGAKNVVVDDATLDILSEHFNPQDTLEADIYFRYTSSPMNPNQLGTRDRYILTISDFGLQALDCIEEAPTLQM